MPVPEDLNDNERIDGEGAFKYLTIDIRSAFQNLFQRKSIEEEE